MGYKFEIHKTVNDQYYWRFVAPNGEIMCHSESFTTKQSAQHGASSVKSNAANAEIVDLA